MELTSSTSQPARYDRDGKMANAGTSRIVDMTSKGLRGWICMSSF